MTAFEISDIKSFMSRLFGSPLFDHFLLAEATIQTVATYHIDGQLNRSFFSEKELEEKHLSDCPCAPFSLLRESCFTMMKGKNVPLSFQFVFQLSPENMARTLNTSGSTFTSDDVSAMFINLNYKNGKLICTTGISYKLFSMDKSLDREWDALVEKFFKKNRIEIDPVQ